MHPEPSSSDKSQNGDGCEELDTAANAITSRNAFKELKENQPSNASTNHACNNSTGNASASNQKINHDEPASHRSLNNQQRYKNKSSSFNGVTIQQLQIKRLENQAVANRQRRSRLHSASEGDRESGTIIQATSLPIVRDATKHELLRLNQRYAPSVAFIKARSHTGIPSRSIEADTGPQQYIVDRNGSEHEHDNSQASPFNLILRGISTGSTDEKQSGKNHQGASGGHYLLHLEHLARDHSPQSSSIAAKEAFGNIIDDEASSSSSYASPTPHLQAASACDSNACNADDISCSQQILKFDEDEDTNYFSCLCKAHALISDGEERGISGATAVTELEHTNDKNRDCSSVLQNVRLKKIAICMMHALTILGIVLACSWVEFLQVKMTTWFWSYWILSPTKYIGQILPVWMDAARKSLVNFLCLGNYGDPRTFLEQMDLQNPTHVFARTRHVSMVVWHGFHTLCSDWIRNIDSTSFLIETWFRVLKLQCDCRLFVYDIIKRLKACGKTTSMLLNTTVTNMMSSMEEDAFIQSPQQTGTDKPIILRKPKSTIPFEYSPDTAITSISSWHNHTLPLQAKTQKIHFKSTKTFWKAAPLRRDRYSYSHNTASFRYVQNSLPAISPDLAYVDVLLLNDHQVRHVASNNDVPSFHLHSYEVLPYRYGNLHLDSLLYPLKAQQSR